MDIVKKQFISAVPLCPVFKECGGCQYQDIIYQDELKIKEQSLKDLIGQNLSVTEDVFRPIVASPREYRYRNRLDLKLIKNKKNEIQIGFSPQGKYDTLPIDDCAIADQKIANAIPRVKQEAIVKLPEKYRTGNIVVRVGDEGRVLWGGLGKRSLQLDPRDYFWTEIQGKRIYYSLDTFFQANLFILPKFIDHLRALNIFDRETLFFDLYGGVGLFGVCLSDLVDKIILIEDNPASIKVALHNIEYNRIGNFEVHRGKVEDVFDAKFVKNNQKKVIMVDPPRAGLSEGVVQFLNRLRNVDYLLYLSCNPQTLVNNLKDLTNRRWQVESITPFDFFPKTRHLETFVVLKKRQGFWESLGKRFLIPHPAK